jgi:predicted nuclease of predicted toxin-antitoxin system
MRFKLDENLDTRLVVLLAGEGLETDTVLSENLSGTSDERLYETCVKSERILVTLDLDFSNPLRFPPEVTSGIIVLRPARPGLSRIRSLLATAVPTLKSSTLKGKLWIVEPGRIREYEREKEDEM